MDLSNWYVTIATRVSFLSGHVDMLISSTNGGVLCNDLMLQLISPSDVIQRHTHGPTLAQVMATCLAASSHYPNQCLLIINLFCGIHMTTISHSFLKISIHDISLKNTYLKVQPHLPGANDLTSFNDKGCVSLYHRLLVLLYAAGNINHSRYHPLWIHGILSNINIHSISYLTAYRA